MARISNEDFVVAFATSETMEDMVKATGLSRGNIHSRRHDLMKKGVNFPKLQRSSLVTKLDVARLNSLIKKNDIRRKRQG